MLSAAFVCGANGILPVELAMGPAAEAPLFEETEQFAGFTCKTISSRSNWCTEVKTLTHCHSVHVT